MPNRLKNEASPYLQQHAENPVDWYPWGEEALLRAKREDKPILLSIGYSACHWCHVMEHESFADEDTAKFMNERFVSIKVDREERPDLDQVYQMVVQLLGGSGGWPLTVFLTPDQKPFFGGTYFPNRERHGMPSFQRVLSACAEGYRNKKDDVVAQAAEISEAIGGILSSGGTRAGRTPTTAMLAHAAKKLSARFDDYNGGFGDRPKFPNATALELLMLYAAVSGDERAKLRVKRALDKMRAGGIWDHLGGGFHRYSTDEKWLVPHFEKMLYDNALLLRAYTDGFRLFGDAAYAATARAIAAWVAREMTHENGAFYSTQDADSEGREGKFFVWSPAEVRAAAGADADVALEAFGVTDAGNFDDPHGGERGKTVLFAAKSPSDAEALERARKAMWAVREERIKPFRDEKILTSWNALMIGALAESAGALDEPDFLARAKRAYAFVRTSLAKDGMRLARLVKDGVVKGEGFLDDYAYLANAALDLYEASGSPEYLEDAAALSAQILGRFHDREGGGFFFAPADAEALIVRAKDTFDSAVPSGAASAIRAFLRVGAIADEKYMRVAEQEIERAAEAAVENPFAFGHLLANVDRLARGSVDVVLVGKDLGALAKVAYSRYVPHRNLVWIDPNDARSAAAAKVLAEGKTAKNEALAYVCRGRACSLPLTNPDDLARALRG